MTTTTNSSRRCPVVSSMPGPRYLDRRRDRAQNGAAAGCSAPPAAPLEDSPERGRVAPPGHALPVLPRDADAGPWRTGGGVPAPPWRTGGCAGRRAPVPVPVAPLRAQPAVVAPLTGAPPLGSGSGGAVRPVPTPASGHCLALTWLSATGAVAVPSGTVAPAAATAPPSAAVPSPVPSAAVPRRAQRDARDAPVPGTTTPAAPAVTRRKPKADSRKLTLARSSAPSMP